MIQAVRALAVTLWTSKKYNGFQTNIRPNCFIVVSSKVWKQFMKYNTSFYLKNMALAGPSLVFLVSRLITASPGPPKYHFNVTGCSDWLKESGRTDKENLSRWWGEDRENPRDEPLSLDRALARSRWEVLPEGFPILTSSTWLIIYLAYLLPKPHFNQTFFGLQSIWPIYRVGKCRLTSPSDVITTCVRTHSRTSNG